MPTTPNTNGCYIHNDTCTYDATLSGRARHVHSVYRGFTIARLADRIVGVDWYDIYDPVTKHYQTSARTLGHARVLINDLIK